MKYCHSLYLELDVSIAKYINSIPSSPCCSDFQLFVLSLTLFFALVTVDCVKEKSWKKGVDAGTSIPPCFCVGSALFAMVVGRSPLHVLTRRFYVRNYLYWNETDAALWFTHIYVCVRVSACVRVCMCVHAHGYKHAKGEKWRHTHRNVIFSCKAVRHCLVLVWHFWGFLLEIFTLT